MRSPFSAATIVCVVLLAVGGSGCSRYTYPVASQEQPSPRKKPQYDLGKLAHRIHQRVNKVRSRRGKDELAWNATLADLAEDHSRDMAEHDFFAHDHPDGRDATARAQAANFSCRIREGERTYTGVAENLFYTSPYRSYEVTRRSDQEATQYQWKDLDEVAGEVVQGWMESAGHRRNLLNARHRSEGLGLARGEDDDGHERIYVTQDFC